MTSSYLNIVTFLLTTLFYYLALKPPLSLSQRLNDDEYKKYVSNNYMYLGIYLLLIMVIQFIVNASIISNTCGGNITENMGAAGLFTFFPWFLIFGILIIVLILYPGFKSAFSDVIGYFYVSSSANKIITELLVNKDVKNNLQNDSLSENQSQNEVSRSEVEKLENAADAIVKICGNTSILINQIVPSNFEEYWNILNPLMKQKYQGDNLSGEALEKKTELFELVVTRDNIGEAMWYIYTGIMVTSIIQLKIATRGCVSNPATMEKKYRNFLEEQQAVQARQDLATSSVYTITG